MQQSRWFQSTRPMRGATAIPIGLFRRLRVSIHAPHAGRDLCCEEACGKHGVSIHAPHAGRDVTVALYKRLTKGFQSTRPMLGATREDQQSAVRMAVSIHAPHAGRDISRRRIVHLRACFNPRAPCGARQRGRRDGLHRCCFNPRAPCGARPHVLRVSNAR